MADLSARSNQFAIWGYAFGYFACYAPYSALTKAISQGKLPGMSAGVSGFAVLPISTLASLVGMMVFISAMGWWKYARHRDVFGLSMPVPGRWTFLSGLCASAIIATTTLAYTFRGVSIVFMMLLMRGGVLVIAPLVDAISKRHVRWFSWIALALSLGALISALAEGSSYELTVVAIIDVVVYLASYFVRLRFMSNLAKSDDRAETIRYFVEEQMVATPAVVLFLGALALIGQGDIMTEVRYGFTELAWSPITLALVGVGLLSQGTGVFGGLILLDRSENTFCVPVNRASSVLAGLVASWLLWATVGGRTLSTSEIVGASLVIAAIFVLALPSLLQRRKTAQQSAQGEAVAAQ